ncbi:DUF4265 domain-containing protein [Nakamurella silvestris]|nr:DUF4265 domain-containing protein [Nakamurella silvestris]
MGEEDVEIRMDDAIECTHEHVTIGLFVGKNQAGSKVLERVLVRAVGLNRFRILATPGLASGIARGDEIQLQRDTGEFRVLGRGGFVGIQIYGLSSEVDRFSLELRELGGWLDSRSKDLTVFSIPVSVGFPRIEAFMRHFVMNYPGSLWYYANVYGDDGITPLNWWKNQA